MSKLSHNVAHEEAKEVKLLCGHKAKTLPVVTFNDGRKMYQCPEGCGLIQAKRR